MSSAVIGKAPCKVCGHIIEWKKSAQGRITGVCKWQDSGCGSQVQGLTPDACSRLITYINKHGEKPAKPEPEEKPAGNPETVADDAAPSLLGGWL